MYWIPILVIPMAVALIKVGALSLWVYVLSGALAVATAVIVAVSLWELLRRFRRM